jgi:hypothetical protein
MPASPDPEVVWFASIDPGPVGRRHHFNVAASGAPVLKTRTVKVSENARCPNAQIYFSMNFCCLGIHLSALAIHYDDYSVCGVPFHPG